MLSPKQLDLLKHSTNSFNIAEGAVSSGKTFVMNLRWYKHMYDVPENSLLLLSGKTSESLYDNVIRDLIKFDIGVNELIYTKQPQRLYIPSRGIEVACASADNELSWGRIQGKTVFGWYGDEIVRHSKAFVSMAHSRCRGEGKIWPKFWSCNPDNPQHYILKQYIQNDKINKAVWHFTLDDNPVLSEEYKNELKSTYSGVFYDRYILGKWVLAEGVVYGTFQRGVHLVKDIPDETISEYIIGIDWGYEHPLALVLMAVDYDGTYYVVDEMYLKHQHIDESLIKAIKDRGWMSLKRGDMPMPISYCYADSARPDYINLFWKLSGLPVLPAAKTAHSVIEGIQLVSERFKNKRLFIKESCINTISELELYAWKDKKGETQDEPTKDNDHIMDAMRYIMFTRERGRVRVFNKPGK